MVLIVAAPAGDRYRKDLEVRKLAKLEDGLSYVHTLTDGLHRIHAMLIWPYETKGDLRDWALVQERGVWTTDLITFEGDGFLNAFNQKGDLIFSAARWGLIEPMSETGEWKAIVAHTDLDVSEDCFAAPPPVWAQTLVNFWYARNRAIDQCDFRRLFGWSVVLSPFMILNFLIRLVVTCLATFMLFREINWQPLYHFFDFEMEDSFRNFTRGNYLWPRNWRTHILMMCVGALLLPFNPLVLTFIGVISWKVSESASEWLISVLILIGAAQAIMVAPFAILFLFALSRYLYDRFKTNREERNQAEPPSLSYLQEDTMAFLACGAQEGAPTAPPRSLSTIPLRRRTMRLWFESTKAIVCKPFAR